MSGLPKISARQAVTDRDLESLNKVCLRYVNGDREADIEDVDDRGRSALWWCAAIGWLEGLEKLILSS